jgi:hypothetical protein
MLIYSAYQNERFRFAVEMVLFRYEGRIEYTSDIEYLNAYQGPKLAYGENTGIAEAVLALPETPWMWDSLVHAKLPRVKEQNQITKLYFTEEDKFDVFAAVFWMLSRYEEYIALKHDKHGRFMAVSSVLGWDNDTQRPWTDIWRFEFTDVLQRKFPEMTFRQANCSMKMTIDVDSAFAYRHKGIVRTTGAMVKDMFRGNFRNLMRRLSCVVFATHDPYDTYEQIASECDQAGMPLQWFFLLADRSMEDVGLSYKNPELRKRIQTLARRYAIGIHPGYASNSDESILKEETRRLEEILGRPVTMSRQHYLKMQLPQTYQHILTLGIEQDHTLGFAENTGFRAGTNFPFPWFDLRKNERTTLMLHPFAVMDTTLRDYLGLTPDEAIAHIKVIFSHCRKTGCEFTFLWHNESLSEMGKWKGWSKVFQAVMKMNEECRQHSV